MRQFKPFLIHIGVIALHKKLETDGFFETGIPGYGNILLSCHAHSQNQSAFFYSLDCLRNGSVRTAGIQNNVCAGSPGQFQDMTWEIGGKAVDSLVCAKLLCDRESVSGIFCGSGDDDLLTACAFCGNESHHTDLSGSDDNNIFCFFFADGGNQIAIDHREGFQNTGQAVWNFFRNQMDAG